MLFQIRGEIPWTPHSDPRNSNKTNFNHGSDKFGQKKPRCPKFSIHSIMCLKDNGQELLKVAPVFPFGLL